MSNNRQEVMFLMVLAFSVCSLFIHRALQFKGLVGLDGKACWQIIVARGCG